MGFFVLTRFVFLYLFSKKYQHNLREFWFVTGKENFYFLNTGAFYFLSTFFFLLYTLCWCWGGICLLSLTKWREKKKIGGLVFHILLKRFEGFRKAFSPKDFFILNSPQNKAKPPGGLSLSTPNLTVCLGVYEKFYLSFSLFWQFLNPKKRPKGGKPFFTFFYKTKGGLTRKKKIKTVGWGNPSFFFEGRVF